MKKNNNNRKYEKNELEKMIVCCSINTINRNFDLLIENQKLKSALNEIKYHVLNLNDDNYCIEDSFIILSIIKDVLDNKKED